MVTFQGLERSRKWSRLMAAIRHPRKRDKRRKYRRRVVDLQPAAISGDQGGSDAVSVQRLVREVIASEFDTTYYLDRYDDVRAVAASAVAFDALDHYVEMGWKEGRDPNADFSTEYYIQANPDVSTSGINPFFHFLTIGRRKGLSPSLKKRSAGSASDLIYEVIAKEFDCEYYLRTNRDIARVKEANKDFDPIAHYITNGWREGRNPRADFSTSDYMLANPDVVAANLNPFYHYIGSGRREGRAPTLPGGFRTRYLRTMRSLPEVVSAWTIPSRPYLPKSAAALAQAISSSAERTDGRIAISLSHDNYIEGIGGVQLCVRQEQQECLALGCTYLNIHPVQPLPILAASENWSGQLVRLVLNGEVIGVTTAANLIAAIEPVATSFTKAAVFVHAMHGLTTEMVLALADAVPDSQTYFWLHDFFSVCPGYNLLRNDITYCGAPSPDSQACSICKYGDSRREHISRFTAMFESARFTVVSPSDATLDLWKKSSHLFQGRAIVHPHCALASSPAPARDAAKPIKFAFIGSPTVHKGWPVFKMLADAGCTHQNYQFYYFGMADIGETQIEQVKVSVSLEDRSAMSDALAAHEIDYAIVWSLCPETFCFAAYEAAAAGAYVVTNRDSGNVARMAADKSLGMVLADEHELLEHLNNGFFERHLGKIEPHRGSLDFRCFARELFGDVQ